MVVDLQIVCGYNSDTGQLEIVLAIHDSTSSLTRIITRVIDVPN